MAGAAFTVLVDSAEDEIVGSQEAMTAEKAEETGAAAEALGRKARAGAATAMAAEPISG